MQHFRTLYAQALITYNLLCARLLECFCTHIHGIVHIQCEFWQAPSLFFVHLYNYYFLHVPTNQ